MLGHRGSPIIYLCIRMLGHRGSHFEMYKFTMYMFVFFITGYRRAVEVGWAMGERQKRNYVFTSFANHIHLPNDFQLLPSRYSGIYYLFT